MIHKYVVIAQNILGLIQLKNAFWPVNLVSELVIPSLSFQHDVWED